MKENTNRNFWTGIIVGLLVSVLTSLTNSYFQHKFSIKEKNIQLYLDEKKDFVNSCDNYLREYRQWHELMNYFIYKDSTNNQNSLVEFENRKKALIEYVKWKKNFDYAYTNVFLYSDKAFGLKTMEVSTVLHNSLSDMIWNLKDTTNRTKTLEKIDNYFFENWLTNAKKEIDKFNSGERQK